LSSQVFTVVGVMPADFQFPVQTTAADFWTTIALDGQSSNGNPPMTAQRGVSYLDVIGRLKGEVTIAQAQSEMAAIQKSLSREYRALGKSRTRLFCGAPKTQTRACTRNRSNELEQHLVKLKHAPERRYAEVCRYPIGEGRTALAFHVKHTAAGYNFEKFAALFRSADELVRTDSTN
jgi:hypothetical protein